MALLLSCREIGKVYGSLTLFEGISFSISDGDRVGLIGPNGSGKTTLLEIVAGRVSVSNGEVASRKLLRLAYVPQDPQFEEGDTVRGVLESTPMFGVHDELEREGRLNLTLGRTGFTDPGVAVETLSGGWKKRLAIARELLKAPELLILDEPTNHLDVDGIVWLEKLLKSAAFASLVVSHDRYFLENTTNSMMEINRAYPDGLFAVKASYGDFLVKKADLLHAQSKRQEALENMVRREVEWLRRGPKARTTKSKSRIDAAGRLIGELKTTNARTSTRTASFDFIATDRQTRRLVDVKGISKTLGGRELFSDLSFVLSPGVRLGLLGPNGSGKTTLLKLLAGEIQPDAGVVTRADAVKTLYFDQNRDQLDPAITLKRALAPDSDSVVYRGLPVHVHSWAARFLFRVEQLELRVGSLSGGEQARVLIARLMLQSADLLLLDEPTNDLDITTLEVLEESLIEFPGAVVLVTHDRYMLDRVSTTIVGLSPEGAEVYADCSQWEKEQSARKPVKDPAKAADSRSGGAKKKLSYTESREFDQMEARIQEAEARLGEAHAEMQNPEGSSDAATMHRRYDSMQEAQTAVDGLYARWADLEAKLVS